MKEIIGRYGRLKWKRVAELMCEEFGISSKNHKQCRERWANHLNPSLEKRGWTAEEEHYLFFYQRIFGNKWSKIREVLPHRPENSIKNHFYSTLKKKIKKYNRSHPEQTVSEDINQVQTNPDLIEFLINFQESQDSRPNFAKKPMIPATQSTAVQTEDIENVSQKPTLPATEDLTQYHWQSNLAYYPGQWPYLYSFYQGSN